MIHILPRDLIASRLGPEGLCLVVEDDMLIRLDVQDILSQLGVPQTVGAGSVAQALKLLADQTVQFAILDFRLSDGNSLALAEVLVQDEVPFLFLTGYGADAEIPASLAHVPVLSKPFTTALLTEAMLRALGGTTGET